MMTSNAERNANLPHAVSSCWSGTKAHIHTYTQAQWTIDSKRWESVDGSSQRWPQRCAPEWAVQRATVRRLRIVFNWQRIDGRTLLILCGHERRNRRCCFCFCFCFFIRRWSLAVLPQWWEVATLPSAPFHTLSSELNCYALNCTSIDFQYTTNLWQPTTCFACAEWQVERMAQLNYVFVCVCVWVLSSIHKNALLLPHRQLHAILSKK